MESIGIHKNHGVYRNFTPKATPETPIQLSTLQFPLMTICFRKWGAIII